MENLLSNVKVKPPKITTTTQVIDELGIELKKSFLKYLEDCINAIDTRIEKRTNYKKQLELIQKGDTNTLYIDFSHLQSYDIDLADAIVDKYYRYERFLRDAIDQLVQKYAPNHITSKLSANKVPEYWVAFYNLGETLKIRSLRTEQIGRLTTFCGTVTRTSSVRPELLYGRFICLDCGTPSEPIEQQFRYTQPVMCSNSACSNRTRWNLDLDSSQFVDWQRVRVQENASEIPSGSMPRCIDVIMRNDCVEKAKAGDRCLFTGTLIVVPDVAQMVGHTPEAHYTPPPPTTTGEVTKEKRIKTKNDNVPMEGLTGLKVLGVRDLSYRLCFLCNHVESMDSRSKFGSYKPEEEFETLIQELSHEELSRVKQMTQEKNLLDKLVKSIAPNVYGHEDVKKGILLMMFGGVHKVTEEGINLRGDINVCIVGDPSTSKSQFLKYVASLLPRAVYTSGKASSAGGLTASVIKNQERGEFAIEAGALMLADNGVCCIDEFDKMDVRDQVAIHEAMEQQTISIAKAGIRATLNARTSILAAANPIGGRYNPKKTLKQNLGISPPIMSRFDLFFVVQDECNEITDRNIAEHIVSVHQNKQDVLKPYFSVEDLKLYIRYCRTLKPTLSEDAQKLLVESYRKLRQHDKTGVNAYRMTVRQLESLIRLSEALAKLHAEATVTPSHVKEAVELLRSSITKIDSDPISIVEDEEYWDKRRRNNQLIYNTTIEQELIQRKKTKDLALKKAKNDLIPIEEQLQMLQEKLKEERSESERSRITLEISKLQQDIDQYNEIIEALREEIEQISLQIKDQVVDEVEERPAKKVKRHNKKSRKVNIDFAKYKELTFDIVRRLKQKEHIEGICQMKVRELVDYLVEQETEKREILSDMQLEDQIKLFTKIIQRLVITDHVLIDMDINSDDKDFLEHEVQVHPNYYIEE